MRSDGKIKACDRSMIDALRAWQKLRSLSVSQRVKHRLQGLILVTRLAIIADRACKASFRDFRDHSSIIKNFWQGWSLNEFLLDRTCSLSKPVQGTKMLRQAFPVHAWKRLGWFSKPWKPWTDLIRVFRTREFWGMYAHIQGSLYGALPWSWAWDMIWLWLALRGKRQDRSTEA